MFKEGLLPTPVSAFELNIDESEEFVWTRTDSICWNLLLETQQKRMDRFMLEYVSNSYLVLIPFCKEYFIG